MTDNKKALSNLINTLWKRQQNNLERKITND